MLKFKIMGYDEFGGCPLILATERFDTALKYIEMEMGEFGNLFKLKRFDVYDLTGVVLRRYY